MIQPIDGPFFKDRGQWLCQRCESHRDNPHWACEFCIDYKITRPRPRHGITNKLIYKNKKKP